MMMNDGIDDGYYDDVGGNDYCNRDADDDNDHVEDVDVDDCIHEDEHGAVEDGCNADG